LLVSAGVIGIAALGAVILYAVISGLWLAAHQIL
jgi:hypothetical protein